MVNATCDTNDIMQKVDAPCDTNDLVQLGDANGKHHMITDSLNSHEKELVINNKLIRVED